MTVVLVLGGTGFAGYSEWKFRELGEALSAEVATYKLKRWDRPALRGNAGTGNAAFDALQALAGLPALSPEQLDAFALNIHYGEPLGAAELALLEREKPRIAKLRAASLLGSAMTEVALAPGDASTVPNYPQLRDAILLLLSAGAQAGPDECLLACADAVRIGQDFVPGAALEAASIAARIAAITSPLTARCASLATPEALFRAAREFHVLALHPPPTFSGIELADLLGKRRLLGLAEIFGEGKDAGDSALARLRRRPALFDAVAYFDHPARWRDLSPANYPESMQAWLRENEWRSHAELPLVAEATADVDGWLLDDMRGQAVVRTLSAGLSTLAERVRRKRMPREPMGLAEPGLRDPFNGQPLKWRIAQDGAELALWSVGEDLRDDKGSSEWTAQAPVDVVVHFKLRPFDDGDASKHTARR